MPSEPVIFSKFNNALTRHQAVIPQPLKGKELDYEAELVLVIGQPGFAIAEEDALNYVFGYSIGNDLSIRDLQFMGAQQWLLGKTASHFAPVGPWIVEADDLDGQNLDISLELNGKVVQSSNTRHMIFNNPRIISYISHHMTLEPDDLIFTSTPEGVILSQKPEEQNWLTAGDRMDIHIQGIGSLTNYFAKRA